MERVILHCDLNNFYASVECKLDPELNNKAMAVCGDIEERHGIVLAKNNIAKRFGVATGEAIWEAKKKCKELVIVAPHFDEYMKISRKVREIYYRYTDMIECFGLDECWLDVTGSTHLFGTGAEIADVIRNTVKRELGVTVSVGVSFNKIFAKLGSDMKKPDAVTVIPKKDYLNVIGQLPASMLLGVGRNTYKKISAYGIRTIADMAEFPIETFVRLLGKNGIELWKYANGMDDSRVVRNEEEYLDKSVGHGTTLNEDIEDNGAVWRVMLSLSQDIGHRLYIFDKEATGIAIYIKNTKMMTKQWQCKLKNNIQDPYDIAVCAFELFKKSYDWSDMIRSVTVRAIGLVSNSRPKQIGLFDDGERILKKEALNDVIEKLRGKYGASILINAVLMGADNTKSINAFHKI